MKNLLTIAGSDSSGGAGIQADLKTFSALGVYGMSVITAVTAQNTLGVDEVAEIDRDMVKAQIDAVFKDIPVHGVKIGMVSNPEIIKQIALSLKEWKAPNIVVDPVMISKSGYSLLKPEAVETLKRELLPMARVITPNLPEACCLLGIEALDEEGMEFAAQELHRLGPESVLIKGGHLKGAANDLLFDGDDFSWFKAPHLNQKHTHGTGCTLSSAIAAHLALDYDLQTSVQKSKDYLFGAIEHAFPLGHGVGPVHHFYRMVAR
ncbi:bifunctional hydroxymethylpyrimidine kinase/phosphomethylpyrimidine kinase [Desulfitobacterium chlororespirans]|uniref:Hydroxymethylpyrimidine/phosphomethylpyrimidine kinase n=1 Tax=Desulfitobacterium chlororespirans DSM 11544 TaxID=1121395 RepID=A0A1M7UJE1_9FIRM|nr:bifunctional hydroxymethylpyrimidine kinase/phosphomethylpyrimidine kinase [Desulfitobacterium chlororespirans]SHN83122.1 hydroxymethylpyrimidine/phosphomethylpyrimidine kinase [Desulfitobacterium chlororespirans DSM 11544]